LLSGCLNSNDASRGAPGSFAVAPRDAALDESEAIPDRGEISLRLVDLERYQLPFGHAPVMPEDGCLIVKTEAVSDWPGSSMKIKDPPSRDGRRFTPPAFRPCAARRNTWLGALRSLGVVRRYSKPRTN
jgi:hypothetical protein